MAHTGQGLSLPLVFTPHRSSHLHEHCLSILLPLTLNHISHQGSMSWLYEMVQSSWTFPTHQQNSRDALLECAHWVTSSTRTSINSTCSHATAAKPKLCITGFKRWFT